MTSETQSGPLPSTPDDGMTLIELLVTISVMAIVVAVISSAVVVTLRQQEATQARTDVARWEQALALWLPADLASATDVDADPTTMPAGCGTTCSGSSNVLEMSWGVAPDTTTVGYRYGADGAGGYRLIRVECPAAGPCTSQTVLRDLAAPGAGWAPPQPVPTSIIDVEVPLAVDATDDGGPTDGSTNAQRVIVSVNGAPGTDGEVRSTRVSFTAGGTTRSTIPAPRFEGPTFLDAQSGCGGPITLIVDESGSIGSADSAVESAVRNFVDTFSGTPTRLQVIEFSNSARVVGATGSEWTKFYDLTEPSEVSALKSALSIDAGGGTNWEDALFRTFRDRQGNPYDGSNPLAPVPELVVFFTDGQPTRDRTNSKSDDASTSMTIDAPYGFGSVGWWLFGAQGEIDPQAWFRASKAVNRNVEFIGVGVGGGFLSETRIVQTGWPYRLIDNEVFLGDLVTGGLPHLDGSSGSGQYVKREYDGGWADVDTADLLVSGDLNTLASALAEIALSECGGTLTVQTRTTSGTTADVDVTYRVGSEQSSTSSVRKAAVFDVTTENGAATTVRLIPEIETPGWTAADWNCWAKGVDLGAGYGDVSADPADGVDVTVAANAAVSCTMTVAGP